MEDEPFGDLILAIPGKLEGALQGAMCIILLKLLSSSIQGTLLILGVFGSLVIEPLESLI